ncbi:MULTISPECIES: histidinol-phosphate transaminase [Nitrincola]|uniref:Histidinol-phosphate aminotransferase n=1 Tax=Nitrincola nitratireducens TaxID=1229521 RepID=W9VMB6_9GAMM|nr:MULTISPECIES: histidinol-phosphate transaminase [Nitrincola]EXJ11660.1 Histidinol-phosphate aminotransferase 2 [Nitrincola nitratireducens]
MSCDYVALANSGVQQLKPYQAGKPIEELERELGICNIIKLASNENPLGPSPKAIAAIQQELAELTRYPDSNGHQLKQAISRNFDLDPAQITLGNGSNDLLELITRTFLNSTNEAVYSEFAFVVYPLVVQAVGAKSVVAPAKEFGHNLQAISEAISDKTRLIFIANPNNPTGTVIAKDELCAFLDSIPADILVVLDEAYSEYAMDDAMPNGLALVKHYPNLIVTRTFSKAYGLAALRVGFAVSNPVITDLLNRVRQPFNVNSFAMAAAVACLNDTDYLAQTVALNAQGMQQLTKGIQQMGLGYIPSKANFITIDMGEDALPIYQKLLHEGVIVRPLGVYNLPNHLRVTIGTESENTRFLLALKKVIQC